MAGRMSKVRRLDVWMNGLSVGQWSVRADGTQHFAYDDAWLQHPLRRPLSLSLPLALGTKGQSGSAVSTYFDNLLPDSASIRLRLASRHGAVSADIFDLLEKIGRDCIGAVQLLPQGTQTPDVHRIDASVLSSDQIAARLDAVTASPQFGAGAIDDLRISLAGAQEKTALLRQGKRWYLPHGATPTTHIIKLPLGEVGSVRADFSTSVYNEWLCSKIMEAFGLPVAQCEIVSFAHHTVLAVERFDRQHMRSGWIARLPQEDFCQATGCGPSQKYEEQGGPGMDRILDILRGSQHARRDRQRFLKTQLLFWMLAAPDGHAKNFSIQLLAGDAFELTPLYDVMSAWPVIGRGARQFQWQKIKLAMALRSKNTHYRMADIQRRHWNEVARRNSVGADCNAIIDEVIDQTPNVIDTVQSILPSDFPASVSEPVFQGLLRQAKRLATP